MSDELQIQQGSSSTPYALTGGVIGGVGAGLGAHYLTKPKYSSYEDIIAESQDSFNKKIEAATGEEKDLLTRAKEIREALLSDNGKETPLISENEFKSIYKEERKKNY